MYHGKAFQIWKYCNYRVRNRLQQQQHIIFAFLNIMN